MTDQQKYKKLILLYFCLIFISSIIILFDKFLYPSDWTTSEWLINYQGGFIRRGLIGEILIQINKFINTNPRYLVYVFEIFSLFIFYLLSYKLISKLEINLILLVILFSPISFIFPLSDPESLGRKELILFCIYIFYINSLIEKNENKVLFIITILLPIMFLIWDGAIIVLPFFYFFYIYSKKAINIKKIILSLLTFAPSLITILILFNTDVSEENLKLMCESFNEDCFAGILFANQSVQNNINYVSNQFEIEYLYTYILIFTLSFLPIACFNAISKLGYKNIILLICLMPMLPLFYIASDWGRYMHIFYIFYLFSTIYFIKNENLKFINTSDKFFKNKFYFKVLVFIYLFSWYPKSIMTDDIGSLPYLRVVDRVLEVLF